MADLKKGDKVSWNTSQGRTTGTVSKKVTDDTNVGGHQAKASNSDPQYEVKSQESGNATVHKPGSLKKES